MSDTRQVATAHRACSTLSIPGREKPALALGRIVSLPNLATLVRIPLAALLWVRPADPTWLLAIMAIAGFSNAIDGRVANLLRRRLAPESADEDRAVGAWLDPLCDKTFAVSLLCALAFGVEAPLAVLALIALRELLMLPLIAIYHLVPQVAATLHLDFSSDWTGKLTTVFQFTAIIAILVVPQATWPLAAVTALIGAGATVHYVRRGIVAARLADRQPDVG